MLKMKSLFTFLKLRQKEIDLLQNENKSQLKEIDMLRKENKLYQNAVSPLTSIGIPIENLAALLQPIARNLKPESEKKRLDASYHDSEGSKLASNGGLTNLFKDRHVIKPPEFPEDWLRNVKDEWDNKIGPLSEE
jgi:hypothetical protein